MQPYRFIYLLLFLGVIASADAQQRKVQRLPYIDHRVVHFGFSVGMHTQDFSLKNSGEISPQGEAWFAEIPSFSPGFNVGLLADYCLTEHLNLRLSPLFLFGNKTIIFRDQHTGQQVSQDVKSNYLMIPLHLKYSSSRLNNYRPYVTAGLSAGFDLSRKNNELLRTNVVDCYLEIGLGCDFYLSYFKLIPELKFCIGLTDIIQRNRPDLVNPDDIKYTRALSSAFSRLVVLSFYFE